MTANIQMWPDEVIRLNEELATGLHPKLEAIFTGLPPEIDFAERLGHIAAYCDLILDGMYSPDDIAGICGTLVKRLEAKRERPESSKLILQQEITMSEPSPHVSRMLVERFELYSKEISLRTFIDENPLFKTLDFEDRELMKDQLKAMSKYREILEKRIAKAESK